MLLNTGSNHKNENFFATFGELCLHDNFSWTYNFKRKIDISNMTIYYVYVIIFYFFSTYVIIHFN